MALETNSFSAKTNKANAFGAEDETTRLALKMNEFSTKDGKRLMLKANVFGAKDELTCLVIDRNAFQVGDLSRFGAPLATSNLQFVSSEAQQTSSTERKLLNLHKARIGPF